MDLRAVHPDIYIHYAPGAVPDYAHTLLGYQGTGKSCGAIASQMREEIAGQLIYKFGRGHVDTGGSKAIRLTGLAGSRTSADIMPCLVCHYVLWNSMTVAYETIKGIAIFDKNGGLTIDFPEHHRNNGVAKRARTMFRFKKNVRMLKHIRDEFVEDGTLRNGEVPSFLVESLVYRVEDEHFLVEWDERYDRSRRVLERMHAQLNVPAWAEPAQEINDIKFLFGPHQRWSLKTAQNFAEAALVHLIT